MLVTVDLEWTTQFSEHKTFTAQTGREGKHVEVPVVTGTCSKCGHVVQSYGNGEASVLRTLAAMREECPYQEGNFYVDAEEHKHPSADAKVERLLSSSKYGLIRLTPWETGFLNDALHGSYTFRMIAKVDEIHKNKVGW